MNSSQTSSGFMKRNPITFESMWDSLIKVGIERYALEDYVEERNSESLKEEIKNAYNRFNEHCSQEYMVNSGTPLDRHKVAACLVYAISETRPLKIDYESAKGTDSFFANERMALWVGYSLLTSSLLHVANDKKTGLNEDEIEKVRNAIMHENPFPDCVGHGESYIQNLVKAICFTAIEQNYNILLLANIFFLWEEALIPNECHKKILEQYSKMAE